MSAEKIEDAIAHILAASRAVREAAAGERNAEARHPLLDCIDALCTANLQLQAARYVLAQAEVERASEAAQ